HPDGDYVFEEPTVDDSPTIHRAGEDLKEIRSGIRSGAGDGNPPGKTPETGRSTGDGNDSGNGKPPETGRGTKEEEDKKEEDDMHRPMRRMVYVITATGGILLALIIIYLIASSTGILRRQRQEATTEQVTTASTTEEVMVSMPYLISKDIETAETMLEQNNLAAGFEYEDGVSETDRYLIVTKQEYNAGTKLKPGTRVLLTIGISPDATTQSKRVEVPALINMKESEAEIALANVGLKVEKVYASSDTVKSGYVIKQNPTAGTEVDLGFTITVTISRGMSQVKVPLLTGLSKKAAKEQLNNVGLNLGEVTSDYDGSVGMGEVCRQGTEAGTMVDRGTYVDVVISLGDRVSFHYEGEIYIIDSPFAEGESGKVEFKILEDKNQGTMTTIYTDDDMKAGDFPFTYTFERENRDEVIVIMYVNGSEYRRDTVEVTAVED
ncbi:MAG: PASTA domain-containing protein, partial [Eubacterium sp.]|nr:PASTA domain-containing protein [Eubacterium sp.]